jgi:HPt (histidine-containing phosphotransfer) domain-containing protein
MCDGDVAMSDLFAERIAAVRQRFADRLDGRIEVIASAMQQSGSEDGLAALVLAHREAHGLCGVGATLGYVETGKVARSIEQMLLAAVKAGRMLADDEMLRLSDGIVLLRSTAIAEQGSAK